MRVGRLGVPQLQGLSLISLLGSTFQVPQSMLGSPHHNRNAQLRSHVQACSEFASPTTRPTRSRRTSGCTTTRLGCSRSASIRSRMRLRRGASSKRGHMAQGHPRRRWLQTWALPEIDDSTFSCFSDVVAEGWSRCADAYETFPKQGIDWPTSDRWCT